MRFQSPRGTEDVLPSDSHRWRRFEETFRNLVSRYGYGEIRTPTFEETALFARSVGDTSDIVTKEMYVFEDKGGRSMCLKPEGTAGVMRAMIEHSLCPQGAVARMYYITPFFRYERPQKGRLREPHQAGLELVGSPSPAADAEVIEITTRFYQELGMDGVRVGLNSIGRGECRSRFSEAMMKIMAPVLADQSEEFRAKVEKNPLRLLDNKDPAIRETLTALPPITDFLEDESRANFEALQALLNEREIPYDLAPGIVRGLDYYTDTVFEISSTRLGAKSELCGGGRYDTLVAELGGPSTPSVGVGMGIERALLALEAMGLKGDIPRPDFYGVCATPSARLPLQKIADELRASGRTVILDVDSKNLRGQLKQADRYLARYALILGEDELAKGIIAVRDLDAGAQFEVAPDSILERLAEL